MDYGLPYGMGCRFARSRGNRYCRLQAQHGWSACIRCSRLEKHPNRELIISDLSLLVCSQFFTAFATKADQEGV